MPFAEIIDATKVILHHNNNFGQFLINLIDLLLNKEQIIRENELLNYKKGIWIRQKQDVKAMIDHNILIIREFYY